MKRPRVKPALVAAPALPAVVAILLAAAGGASAVSVESTTLVSRASGSGAPGDASSAASAISADGRYVAFESAATNLGGDAPDGGSLDIYRRDTLTGQTRIVSAGVTEPAFGPSISDDGCRVAYITKAKLDPADHQSKEDAYVTDLCASPVTNAVASRDDGPDGNSSGALTASISGDGDHVAFTINNPVTTADGEHSVGSPFNVFVRDLAADVTELASETVDGEFASEGASISPGSAVLSDDGTKVAFHTIAADMVPGGSDTNGAVDIFVRDLGIEGPAAITRVSLAGGDTQLSTGALAGASISGDGSTVAFASSSPELEGGGGSPQLYARDLGTGMTELVSRASGPAGAPGTATGSASQPTLSENGRSVAFSSDSTNLSSADGAGDDVFVRDRLSDLTALVSRTPWPASAPAGSSQRPSISDGAEAVSFDSTSTLLGASPTRSQVYLRGELEVPPPPVQGVTLNVRPVSGIVKIKEPGWSRFELLTGITEIPVRTLVDTRRGTVEVNSANPKTGTQSARFWQGLFKAKQPKTGNGLVTAALVQKLNCGKRRRKGRRARAAGEPIAMVAGRRRGLWGRGRGRYRTRGRRSSGTVRGTTWLVRDTCRFTVTYAREGVVAVNDFTKPGAINALLHAGERYVAYPASKAKRKKKRRK